MYPTWNEVSAQVQAVKQIQGFHDASSLEILKYSEHEPQDKSSGPILVFQSFDDGAHTGSSLVTNLPSVPHSFEGLYTHNLRTSKSCGVASSPIYNYSTLT
jgi:hypothetical protein